MSSINWVHLCDYAFVADDKVSIIGLCDFIGVGGVPATQAQIFLVFSVTINPADKSVSFGARLSNPSGDRVLAIKEYPAISVHGSGAVTKNIVTGFYDIPLPELGEYHVEILANGESVHFVPLVVKLAR